MKNKSWHQGNGVSVSENHSKYIHVVFVQGWTWKQ